MLRYGEKRLVPLCISIINVFWSEMINLFNFEYRNVPQLVENHKMRCCPAKNAESSDIDLAKLNEPLICIGTKIDKGLMKG